MKNSAILILLLLISCSEKPKANPDNDFTDKVISFSIDNPNDTYIELPELYEYATKYIAADKDENVIIAERLKTRGFKVTNVGHTNSQLSGRRMITLTLVNKDCQCEVGKIYYSTANISEYFVAERIKCSMLKNKNS